MKNSINTSTSRANSSGDKKNLSDKTMSALSRRSIRNFDDKKYKSNARMPHQREDAEVDFVPDRSGELEELEAAVDENTTRVVNPKLTETAPTKWKKRASANESAT